MCKKRFTSKKTCSSWLTVVARLRLAAVRVWPPATVAKETKAERMSTHIHTWRHTKHILIHTHTHSHTHTLTYTHTQPLKKVYYNWGQLRDIHSFTITNTHTHTVKENPEMHTDIWSQITNKMTFFITQVFRMLQKVPLIWMGCHNVWIFLYNDC